MASGGLAMSGDFTLCPCEGPVAREGGSGETLSTARERSGFVASFDACPTRNVGRREELSDCDRTCEGGSSYPRHVWL